MILCLNVVCDGVGGHIEEEKVLLLCGEHSLLHQILRQALPNILQLIPDHSTNQLNTTGQRIQSNNTGVLLLTNALTADEFRGVV